MTTGIGPYVVPDPIDTDPSGTTLETTIFATHAMVDIGPTMAHAETFNGAIPGPTLRLNVGDTVIVRLVNTFHHPTGIHWHGIELSNSSDGTEVTQEPALPAFMPAPPPPAPAGGSYLYRFKVRRPGLYWYHPHHHLSINRLFRGMYGMIVVADPNEAALIAAGVIPGAADTKQIVLSDITVCKAPGTNDPETFANPASLSAADRAEWLGVFPQPSPNVIALCEIGPAGATNDDHAGSPAAVSYAAGEVPSIIRPPGRLNEGQTVLTNGVNVGGRLGQPLAPGVLAPGAQTMNVLSGQGLRLQIANCATVRYMRLILTTSSGVQVPLVRIGGEGGLLDNAVVEGNPVVPVPPGTFDTKYTSGEILLPAGSRADVVVAIPPGEPVGSVLTLWTRDYSRTGLGFSNIPTVPVMHLEVTAAAGSTFAIGDGTPLRASIAGAAVEPLPSPDGAFLVPATFAPAKPGMPQTGIPSTQDIEITIPTGINGVLGSFEGFVPYTSAPHINSSRYAEAGRILELKVKNSSSADHPFHLHGFSVQPISLTQTGSPTFTWPYREFRDNINIPGNYTLTFRVRLDDPKLKDGVTSGGALGRWLFHCHIFFHHHHGMISEFVVSDANGKEKPNVDVRGSWAYSPLSGTAQRHGTYFHPDGALVTLSASLGTVMDTGGGTWSWTFTSASALTDYVYITATDSAGRKDQAVFRVKIGPPDDGADNGDPHVHTVDGKHYDFQGVGEFILLRDHEEMEVQGRHWPVQTANPITDSHTGLTSCVSVNTAVAARVGTHRIAYQPGQDRRELEFYFDGKPSPLPRNGLDLGAHRVTTFAVAGGATALRVDYENQTVLTITPYFWASYNIWLLNVSVAHTQADEGIMGRIAARSWLPALPNGGTVGPMPASLHDRYITLYKTFANAWRVTDDTSLFVYAPGTSTKTFTDEDWPAEQPPCKLKPEFRIPGANPITSNIPLETAKQICKGVAVPELNRDCIFDVATTGDKELAKAYLIAQDLKVHGTSVQILANKLRTRPGEMLAVTATVLPLKYDRPAPTGTITFVIDGVPASSPVKLDKLGRASFTTERLKRGDHMIRAAYSGGGTHNHQASSSPNLLHTVGEVNAGPHGPHGPHHGHT